MKTSLFLRQALAMATVTLAAQAAPLEHFITAKGDQLMEGDQAFRFISFNIPNLHYVEDNVAFGVPNPHRLPDRFEVTDALQSIAQQGGTATRIYVLSVVRTNDLPGTPRHVLGPGKFNEAAFVAMDEMMKAANEAGVRVIIPFVDMWSWWGGIAEYAGFRGKPAAAFWTDPQVIADFKETIRFLVTRTNTLTGQAYRDDKAVLAWETGNELLSPAPWTKEIAAYIKSLDKNHLIIDGFHTTVLRPESLAMPEVDIVTTHHYPGGKETYAELARANWAKAKGKKPYFVGEFGFCDTPTVAATLDAVIDTGCSGALVWSLRYRNRDGGFYWHSEPAGGNLYKAYHWPGFPTGADYDEINAMALLRRKAYAIRGLAEPPLPVPAAPNLLPITDAMAISWQGSVGALTYLVERAPAKEGPWSTAGDKIDETSVQYRPLFADTQAPRGSWFYRVKARNAAGLSGPSNVVGPVDVLHGSLVDELRDASQFYSRQGTIEFKTKEARQTLEDAHRAAGKSGSAIIYRAPEPVCCCRLYAFFPKEVADFKFLVSTDGQNFTAVPGQRRDYFSGSGDYGYWKPVYYECAVAEKEARFLKIEWTGEAQIGRVELGYGK